MKYTYSLDTDLRPRGTGSEKKAGQKPGLTVRNWRTFFLGFTDFKYFGTTIRASALGGRAAVLHGNRLGVFNLFFGTALHTVTLHLKTLLFKFSCYDRLNYEYCQGLLSLRRPNIWVYNLVKDSMP